jgi:hypothetical protein
LATTNKEKGQNQNDAVTNPTAIPTPAAMAIVCACGLEEEPTFRNAALLVATGANTALVVSVALAVLSNGSSEIIMEVCVSPSAVKVIELAMVTI